MELRISILTRLFSGLLLISCSSLLVCGASFVDYPSAKVSASWLNNNPSFTSWRFSDSSFFRPVLALSSNGYPDFAFGFFNNGTANTFYLVILKIPKYNKQLINKLLNNMAVDKVDYTNFFRLLSNIRADSTIPEDELLIPLKAVLLDIGKERKEAWSSWVQSYRQELSASGIPDEQRKASMNSVNPKYIYTIQ